MPSGSYSILDSRDYIEYTVKKHLYLYGYINRINNILMFKIKDGYKLELQNDWNNEITDNTKKSIQRGKMERMCQVLKYLRYF